MKSMSFVGVVLFATGCGTGMQAMQMSGMQPGVTTAPGMSAQPGMPGMAGMSAQPGMTGSMDVSAQGMAGMGGMPAQPQMPGQPQMPQVPQPGMPQMPQMAAPQIPQPQMPQPAMPQMPQPQMPAMQQPQMPAMQQPGGGSFGFAAFGQSTPPQAPAMQAPAMQAPAMQAPAMQAPSMQAPAMPSAPGFGSMSAPNVGGNAAFGAAAALGGRQEAPPAPAEADEVLRTVLRPGFQPAHYTLGGVTTGLVDASTLGPGCHGFISWQPDAVVDVAEDFTFLRASVESRDSLAVVIRTPSGAVACDDGRDGTVGIAGATRAGRYQVWVAVAARGARASFDLAFSESPDPDRLAFAR